jgi:hypothetical protein
LENDFTELLTVALPEQPIVAAGGELLFYLVFGLVAAIVSWINKRKEAEKLEQRARAVPAQSHETETTGEPNNWLNRLEQLVEAQLDQTDQKLEKQYDDNYEQESFDLPPVIGSNAPEPPSLFGTSQEEFSELTQKLQEAEQTGTNKTTAPATSPIYDSPIYSSNIARRIASDIQIARQAVVASIILGQPKSLENTEQITRN